MKKNGHTAAGAQRWKCTSCALSTTCPSGRARRHEQADELADFGYYATGKVGEYLQYETSSDLRDSESIPLKQNIHDYFKAEVQPHISEAWLNMESVKIGYEISFNKYFYRHKPLRSLAEVAQDILALEKQADGLISEILEA